MYICIYICIHIYIYIYIYVYIYIASTCLIMHMCTGDLYKRPIYAKRPMYVKETGIREFFLRAASMYVMPVAGPFFWALGFD